MVTVAAEVVVILNEMLGLGTSDALYGIFQPCDQATANLERITIPTRSQHDAAGTCYATT